MTAHETGTPMRSRLQDVTARYDVAINRRSGMSEDVLNILLFVLSYTSLQTLFPDAPKYVLVAVLVVLSLVYLAVRWRPRRRRRSRSG